MKRTFLLAIAALALSAPAARAITWTEIPSGTSATITGVEYQSPTRFWFITSAGGIFKRQPSGSFMQVHPDSSIPLNDIEFQDGGAIGLAVGDGAQVFRSEDSGDTWTAVTGIPVSKKQASSSAPSCTASEPLGAVNSVRFAGNNRVWIFAEGSQLARSQPAAPADVGKTGSWVDANWLDNAPVGRDAGDTCKADHPATFYNDGLADGFFSPTNPDVGWIVQASFAAVLGFTDNLATQATLKAGGAGNTGGGMRALTGDPANSQRMWSVNGTAFGTSTMRWTEDGFDSEHTWTIVNDTYRDFPAFGPFDVDYRGGTVLAAGNTGLILTSVNGRDFYYADDTALAAQDWRSVGVADATNAAVGGTNGKLIISTNANVTPDTVKPTGTISGPATGTTGQPLTYTATLADENSGINAAASTWSTPGLPSQTGPSATFTFPNPGTYAITLTFADNAGNTNAAVAGVTVSAASTPLPGLPAPAGLGGSANKPPLVGGAAKKKGKYVVFRVRGKLGLPAGVTAAKGCNGTISISVYKGKKRLASKRTTVAKTCRYKKTVKVKRKKVGKTRKLKLKVAFKGNAFLAPLSSTYRAKVK